jgi:phage portal protein BeeE
VIISEGQAVDYAPQALGETVPMLSNGYFYPREGLSLANRFATYAALYRAQPSIATVVDKIANSAARLRPKLWDVSNPGGRSLDSTSPLARLLARPSSEMSPYNFWRWTFSTYEVYGEAFWLKQRNGFGTVVNLLPMHPSRVIVKRDPEGNVIYLFSVGVASTGILEVPAEDVVAITRYNPESLMRGMSRLEPLATTLSSEDAARRATQSWWKRGARPSILLKHPGELSQGAQDRLRQQFDAQHAGADNAGSTGVLEEGMDAMVIQLNAEEMQYIESNITEQMRSMYRDTMSPRLEDVESVIDYALTREFYREGLREFEFDMTDVLRGDFESRASSAESLRNTGIATGNEAREIMGLTRSTDPNMEKLFANAALVELGTPAQRITVNAAQPQTPAQQAEAASAEAGGAAAAAQAIASGEKHYTAIPHHDGGHRASPGSRVCPVMSSAPG